MAMLNNKRVYLVNPLIRTPQALVSRAGLQLVKENGQQIILQVPSQVQWKCDHHFMSAIFELPKRANVAFHVIMWLSQ